MQPELTPCAIRKDLKVRKFFLTTASYGPELKDWSKRVDLLNDRRRVADLVTLLLLSNKSLNKGTP